MDNPYLGGSSLRGAPHWISGHLLPWPQQSNLRAMVCIKRKSNPVQQIFSNHTRSLSHVCRSLQWSDHQYIHVQDGLCHVPCVMYLVCLTILSLSGTERKLKSTSTCIRPGSTCQCRPIHNQHRKPNRQLFMWEHCKEQAHRHMCIAECVLLNVCGRQCVPLRGDSGNPGNVLSLLCMMSRWSMVTSAECNNRTSAQCNNRGPKL